MTYDEALKRGEQVGASKAGRLEFLAMICKSLANIHAINPRLVFNGAKKLNLGAKQVATLADADPAGLGDLMFA